MGEIPEDIKASAELAFGAAEAEDGWREAVDIIARVILAERQRCAEAITRLKGGQYIDRGAAHTAILKN